LQLRFYTDNDKAFENAPEEFAGGITAWCIFLDICQLRRCETEGTAHTAADMWALNDQRKFNYKSHSCAECSVHNE